MNCPRTQEQIVERIKTAQERDMLGFEWQEYVVGLTAENFKQFAKPDADLSDWTAAGADTVSQRAKEYLSFWLEKIEGDRGISVQRATMHFIAWKWMLGHPDADTFPGSMNGPDGGYYQRGAYDYIKAQIDSGEWDRMTAEASKETATA